MKKYELIKKGEKPHVHRKPGGFSRLVHRVNEGAIIRCNCGAYYCWETPKFYSCPSWQPIPIWKYEEYGIKGK